MTITQNYVGMEIWCKWEKIYISIIEDVDISGEIILLMDDVTTTGNSLYACKEILLQHGAKSVKMFALGKAV